MNLSKLFFWTLFVFLMLAGVYCLLAGLAGLWLYEWDDSPRATFGWLGVGGALIFLAFGMFYAGHQLVNELTLKEELHRLSLFVRRNFIAGLLVILPLYLTYIILRTLVVFLDERLIKLLPSSLLPTVYQDMGFQGLGLIAGVVAIFAIGLLTRNFFGRWVLSAADAGMRAIPGVRTVYGAIKQVVDTVSQTNSDSFREVVLVEYPRKGIWAMAFVTGKTKGEVQKTTDTEVVNVFMPTTPNPTSGFLLFVPRKDLVVLNMTVDQGIKMVISGGIVTPTLTEGKEALKQQKQAHI